MFSLVFLDGESRTDQQWAEEVEHGHVVRPEQGVLEEEPGYLFNELSFEPVFSLLLLCC